MHTKIDLVFEQDTLCAGKVDRNCSPPINKTRHEFRKSPVLHEAKHDLFCAGVAYKVQGGGGH